MFKSIIVLVVGIVVFNYGWGVGGVVGLLVHLTGIVLALWGGWSLFRSFLGGIKNIPQGIPESVSELKFKHFYKNTGIAVDTENKEVHLKDRSNYKIYKFDQIRSWETNVQTGGQVYGTGLAAIAANFESANANKNNTGLFVKVKDVDFPEWKINFPIGSAKKDLARWMEILQQTLNESVA